MEELALQFFPYPHVYKAQRRDGALVDWPTRCSNCDRQCERSTRSGIQLCSYGVNYVRVDPDLLVAGIVVRDYPAASPARRKMLRASGRQVVRAADVHRIIDLCGEATEQLEAEHRARKDAVIEEYRQSKSYQSEVVDLLRPDLQKTLAQVHDYKQFVQQIVQNLVVTLQLRFPGVPLDSALDQATHEEAAIYWAATLMDERLDAALFLEYPDRIREPREQRRTRLHGLVLKYVRIYKSRSDRKNLNVQVAGESWAQIFGNPRALGIIPHTLIDNAIKYAPDGSKVVVAVEESGDVVRLSVESYGPEIRSDESSRIFDLFYRASAAEAVNSDGTGFGLASAQNVARMHDTQIRVVQADAPRADGHYWTVFSVPFTIDSTAPEKNVQVTSRARPAGR